MSTPEWLDGLVGQSIDGGCDDCGATSTMTKDSLGIFVLTVEHDATCPYFNRREKDR